MTKRLLRVPFRLGPKGLVVCSVMLAGCSNESGAPGAVPANGGSGGATAGMPGGASGASTAQGGTGTGASTSAAASAGAGGIPVVGNGGAAGAAPVAVDCSIAGSVPVSVDFDAINAQASEWYRTAEALTLADNILYYRNEDGGWPKAIDMTSRTEPRDDESTIDNDATTTQIEYLARVYSASGCQSYGDAAIAGIEYLLEAQYDNGGWPQIYPEPEGYPAHITFNDDAMVHVLNLLRGVSSRADHFAFFAEDLAAEASAAVERGVGVILATQIVVEGTKTGWCAQHDEVTLEPARARSYELPSLSGSEGAGLLRFLMAIDNPSPAVIEAVEAAVAWFEEVQITGIRIQSTVDASQETGEDRVVVEDPAAPPLWARFYEIGTNRPIFSSRCEVPQCEDDPFFMRRYSLAEIDNERRVGYAWYGNWPSRILSTTYPAWRERWLP